MITVIRGIAVGAFFAGAAVGLASPAYAEPLSGTYTATATGDDGSTANANWVLTPCGADCLTLNWGVSSPEEMHRQGSIWTSTDSKGCITTMDEGSLAGSFVCPPKAPVSVKLTKVG
jgi:hypothetical protein